MFFCMANGRELKDILCWMTVIVQSCCRVGTGGREEGRREGGVVGGEEGRERGRRSRGGRGSRRREER